MLKYKIYKDHINFTKYKQPKLVSHNVFIIVESKNIVSFIQIFIIGINNPGIINNAQIAGKIIIIIKKAIN